MYFYKFQIGYSLQNIHIRLNFETLTLILLLCGQSSLLSPASLVIAF